MKLRQHNMHPCRPGCRPQTSTFLCMNVVTKCRFDYPHMMYRAGRVQHASCAPNCTVFIRGKGRCHLEALRNVPLVERVGVVAAALVDGGDETHARGGGHHPSLRLPHHWPMAQVVHGRPCCCEVEHLQISTAVAVVVAAVVAVAAAAATEVAVVVAVAREPPLDDSDEHGCRRQDMVERDGRELSLGFRPLLLQTNRNADILALNVAGWLVNIKPQY